MTDPYKAERPVICPYDSNHSIAPSRLHRHLLKCSTNFPEDYRIICSYNATHRLPKDEIQAHLLTCPDRKYVEPAIYELNRTHGSVKSCVDVENTSVIKCDESWDEEECNVLSVSNPLIHSRAESFTRVRRNNQEAGASNFVAPSMPMRLERKSRPPIGLAEALMIDDSEESTIEDVESVTSFMGMGRGKPWCDPNNVKKLQMIGRGRGSGQPKIDD